MKRKYIFSMFAGLIALTATSCKEDVTTVADTDSTASTETSVADTATETPSTQGEAAAYYVMFKGDGG